MSRGASWVHSRTLRWGAVLGLVALTVGVYAPVRHHDFIEMDDPKYVTENVQVQSGLSLEGIRWALTTTHFFNWHPLTWISYMTDVQLFGVAAGPMLLTNLALHVANSLLLFWLLLRMTGAFWRSLLVAALFALHPLHVESVAWVAERKDVLSTFFWMCATWAYVSYAGRPRVLSYVLVFLFFAFGLMAKPMIVTLPFVLLLLDWWPLGRAEIGVKRLLLEKLPLLALSALSGAVTAYAQLSQGGVIELERIPVGVRITNSLISYATYLAKTLWPHSLAVYYPHPMTLRLPLAVVASVFLLAATAIAVRQHGRRPWVAVGWFWYLGTLVPVIGLLQVGLFSMADRYTYVPLIGIFLIVAWAAGEIADRAPWIRAAVSSAACLAVLGSSLLAAAQVRLWSDTARLFEHTLSVTEKNFVAHGTLGKHFLRRHRYAEAVAELERALELEPGLPDPRADLAIALAAQGRRAEAIQSYEISLRIRPDDAATHTNFGLVLAAQGETERAIRQHREALRLDPNLADAHNNLGTLLLAQNRIAEAAAEFRAALRLRPGFVFAHHNLGLTLWAQRRLAEAEEEFRQALRLDPDYVPSHKYLGLLLDALGRDEEAVPHLERARRAEPNDPYVQRALAGAR